MSRLHRAAENLWIETDAGFIGAAWYRPRRAVSLGLAVLIVPGIAHEERVMSGGIAALAESLAGAGVAALAIDLHGCSQSSGRIDDPQIGARWRKDIRAAIHHLRGAGFAQVIVVGIRLGALLAMDALREEPLLGIVAWSPIAAGRRHVRELKVLQSTGAVGVDEHHDGLAIGGFDIPASVLRHIGSLDLQHLDHLSLPHLMLLDSADSLNPSWLTRLSDDKLSIERHKANDTQSWLFSTAEQPGLPLDDIAAVTRWCTRVHGPSQSGAKAISHHPPLQTTVTFMHRGRAVRETFVEIGPVGLAAVLSEPVESGSRTATRLLMSTVGPGRTFTDFARDEASRGNTCLRFDFAGFGSSHRGASAPGGELYTDTGCADVCAGVEYLRRAGHERIFMLGFCAGAWSMIQAGALPGVTALAAINVALYRQPDVPEARGARQRVARWSPRLARMPLLQKLGARIERGSSAKRQPVEWLEALCKAELPVFLAYADLDPGLEYLRRQLDTGLDARLTRQLKVEIYPGLGHLAEGPSARARMFDDLTRFFADLDRRAAPEAAPSVHKAGLRANANASTAAIPTPASTSSISR